MNRTALRRLPAEEGLTASEQEADKLDAKAEAEEDQADADRAKADAARMAGGKFAGNDAAADDLAEVARLASYAEKALREGQGGKESWRRVTNTVLMLASAVENLGEKNLGRELSRVGHKLPAPMF